MSNALSAAEVAALLQQASPPRLLDVREPWEVARAAIRGALAIPMNEIPVRINELNPQQFTVVYCHHGARSLQVVTFLQREGFENVHNLAGGIDAWARNIDSSIAIY